MAQERVPCADLEKGAGFHEWAVAVVKIRGRGRGLGQGRGGDGNGPGSRLRGFVGDGGVKNVFEVVGRKMGDLFLVAFPEGDGAFGSFDDNVGGGLDAATVGALEKGVRATPIPGHIVATVEADAEVTFGAWFIGGLVCVHVGRFEEGADEVAAVQGEAMR